ncbi:hypothetical protein X777_00343 [Ooceraea biroi]|uniref:Uncharacterized protein n=1 Tax=Ooceraea biroi TaxID=2015173 RepID=A0A026WTW4_OOCBI|nr:hypothetical protein X777_00343 [Ooceraea biroi]
MAATHVYHSIGVRLLTSVMGSNLKFTERERAKRARRPATLNRPQLAKWSASVLLDSRSNPSFISRIPCYRRCENHEALISRVIPPWT